MTEEMPPIDVRPEHWALVRDILRRHIPQHAVWAFGSRAKGSAKPYSDLDLAILADQPLDIAQSAALRDAFTESDLPWKVDIVEWAAIDPDFRRIIDLKKVVVQEPPKIVRPQG